jgi:hypothetical protein
VTKKQGSDPGSCPAKTRVQKAGVRPRDVPGEDAVLRGQEVLLTFPVVELRPVSEHLAEAVGRDVDEQLGAVRIAGDVDA